MRVTAIDAMEAYDRLKDECRRNGAPDAELNKGSKADDLEEMLTRYIPDYQFNHDYLLIKCFRRQSMTRDTLRHERSVQSMRELLPKLHCKGKNALGVKLRKMGLAVGDICEVLKVTRWWYFINCQPYAKKPERAVDISTVILEIKQYKPQELEK